MKWYVVVGITFLFGCSDSEFDSFTPKAGKPETSDESPKVEEKPIVEPEPESEPEPEENPTPEEPVERKKLTQDLKLACGDGNNPVAPVFDVKSSKLDDVVANLKGELCPANSSFLRVVFVVDFSASMAKHDKDGATQTGNDPVVNGSCGRYEAVKVVVDKLKSLPIGGGDIDIAFVPFASGIVTPYEIAPVSLATFAANHTKVEQICRFVLQRADKYQDEPGAIPPTDAYKSGTEFMAPLTRARELFAAKKVPSLMYFITDGQPSDPDSGTEAAKELAKLPNLTANSLLLSSDADNARAVLEALTPGSGADRVKDVAQSSQLKNVIDQFGLPELGLKNGDAVQHVDASPDQTIGLAPYASGDLFEKVGQVYRFEVKPFALVGKPGTTTSNFITVSAKGTDGRAYETKIEIRYEITP